MERLTALLPGFYSPEAGLAYGQERHADGREDHLPARLGQHTDRIMHPCDRFF